MFGVLDSGIHFSVSTLDFGRLPAGKVSSLPFTITLDRRLHRFFPDKMIMKVISNNSDILVKRITPAQVGMKGEILPPDEMMITGPADILTDSPTDTKATYKVILSPAAQIGVLKGSLYLFAPEYPSLILLINARVPFSGEVVGDLTSSAPVIVFGSIPTGTATTKSVTFTTHLNALQLKILCPNPKVIAKIIANNPVNSSQKNGGTYKLEVTISPKAPVGVLEDKVTVVTPSGQRLIIPVFASVTLK